MSASHPTSSSAQCASDDDIIHLPVALSASSKQRTPNLPPIPALSLVDLVRKTSLLPNQAPAPETVLLLHSHADYRRHSVPKPPQAAPARESSGAASSHHLDSDPRTTQSALHLISQLPLPRLQPDTSNIHAWLTVFEAACSRVGVPQAHWPASLLFHISPDLFAWVVSLHAPSGVAKQDEWRLVHRQAIVRRFEPQVGPPGAAAAPWDVMRQNGKPVHMYAMEWETASVGWVGAPAHEQWRVKAFIASLDAPHRARVQGGSHSSIGEVVAAVRSAAGSASSQARAGLVAGGSVDVEMVDVSDEDENGVSERQGAPEQMDFAPAVKSTVVVIDDSSDVEMIELTPDDYDEIEPAAAAPILTSHRSSMSPPPSLGTSARSAPPTIEPPPLVASPATAHPVSGSSLAPAPASIVPASSDRAPHPAVACFEPVIKVAVMPAPVILPAVNPTVRRSSPPDVTAKAAIEPAVQGYAGIGVSGSRPSNPASLLVDTAKPQVKTAPTPSSTTSSSSSASSKSSAPQASHAPPTSAPAKFVPIVWPDAITSKSAAKRKSKPETVPVAGAGALSDPFKPVLSVGKAPLRNPPTATPATPILQQSTPARATTPAPVAPPCSKLAVSASRASTVPFASKSASASAAKPPSGSNVVNKLVIKTSTLLPPKPALLDSAPSSTGSNAESVRPPTPCNTRTAEPATSASVHPPSASASATPTAASPASGSPPAQINHWQRVTRPRSASPMGPNGSHTISDQPLAKRPRTTTSPTRSTSNDLLSPTTFHSVPATPSHSTWTSPPMSPDPAAPKQLMFKFIEDSDQEPDQGHVNMQATLPTIAFMDEEMSPAPFLNSRPGIQFLNDDRVEPVGGQPKSPTTRSGSPVQVSVPFKFVASPSPDHAPSSSTQPISAQALVSHSSPPPSSIPSLPAVSFTPTLTRSPERIPSSRPASAASNSSASTSPALPTSATEPAAHALRHWRLRILTNRALGAHFSAGIWTFTRDPRPDEIIDHASPDDKWSTVVFRAMRAARIDRDGGPHAQVWVLDRVNKSHGTAAYERHALSVVDGKYHPFGRDRDVPLRDVVKGYGVDVAPMFTGAGDGKPVADVFLYIEQMPNTRAGHAWKRVPFSHTSVVNFVPVFIKVYDPPRHRRRSRDEVLDMRVSDFRTVGMTVIHRHMAVSSLFAAIGVLSGAQELGRGEKYWLWIEAEVRKDGEGIGMGNRVREEKAWRECEVPWGGVILAREIEG